MNFSQNYNPGSGGGGFLVGSQDSPGQDTKRSDNHAVRPLTILALLNATQAHTDAPFAVDGVEFVQVTLVAQLAEDIEPQSTNILFKLDDGTGRIDGRHWIESHESAEDYKHIKEKSYVRLMGTLKSLGDKKHLTAPHVRLASAREFLYHKSEVMLAYANSTLGPSVNTSFSSNMAVDTSAYKPGATANAFDNSKYVDLPFLERSILEFIQKTPADNNGVPMQSIVSKLSSLDISADKIVSAMDRLMENGHLYTTCDDEHFKMFHSNTSSFNQRQPKAGPSALPLPRFQQDNTNSKPMAFGKRNHPQPEFADLVDRKISTNSRIKKDEKYQKEMYLAYVNNAILQKTKGNNVPFEELVKLFSSGQSQNSQTPTTTTQLRLCLSALSHVVSQLERTHSALIEAIVNLPWAVMDSFFSKSYTSFIGMLVSARPQYLSLVLEKIAIGFTFRSGAQAADAFISADGTLPVTRRVVYERIHGLLEHLLSLIPTLPASLQPLLVRNFPHKRQERVDQETYIRNLLRITEYCPALTDRILALIIDRIIQIDVEIQVELEDLEDNLDNEDVFVLDPFDIVVGQEGGDSDSDGDSDGDALSDISSEAEDMSDNEGNTKPEQDVSHIRDMVAKLDSMMKLLFEYFERVNKRFDVAQAPPVAKSIGSNPNAGSLLSTTPENYDSAHQSKKSLFIILLSIFDRTIIRTFKSRYTQFLVFWYSSLDPEFTDMFQGMLVSKALLEEDQSVVTRAAAASYIASFVSRSLFVDAANARMVVGLMCDFLEHHLDECAALGKDFDPNARYHTVFYTVAQAVFLIFCFRWRDFQTEEAESDDLIIEPVASKKWIPKLDVIPRVIKSELNPLKVCSLNVVQQFARVAHATNFVYCYTIISNNRRSDTHTGNARPSDRGRSATSTIDAELSTFFPFDPYKLPLSNSFIEAVYRDWASVAIDGEDEDDASDGESNVEDEAEDDRTFNSIHLPVNIPGMEDIDVTGGLSNSFGGMSISPVRPAAFTSFVVQ